jgi:hypothetical protein
MGVKSGHCSRALQGFLKSECRVKKQMQGKILWEIIFLGDFDFKTRSVGESGLFNPCCGHLGAVCRSTRSTETALLTVAMSQPKG